MSKCLKCGKKFFCGIEEGKDDCWCFHKPKKQPNGASCYCEDCLMKNSD